MDAAQQAQVNRIQVAVTNSKIPDTIKNLPTFDEESDDLTHWLFTVQTLIDAYQELHQEPIWILWIGCIRQKIVKTAHSALISANVPNDWARIRATLIEHFGNNRELSLPVDPVPQPRYEKRGRLLP